MIPAAQVARIRRALPFWLSLALFPLIAVVATQGGWWLVLMPLVAIVDRQDWA